MKPNKIFAGICAIALIATLGVGTVLATNIDSTTNTTRPAIGERIERRERILLTDEQKEEMDARRASMDASQEKWAALTNEQKEEIYTLREKAANINRQIVDKYSKWGVFDAETAARMKERISEGIVSMRESGRMPMPGSRGGHVRGGFRGVYLTEDTSSTGNTN